MTWLNEFINIARGLHYQPVDQSTLDAVDPDPVNPSFVDPIITRRTNEYISTFPEDMTLSQRRLNALQVLSAAIDDADTEILERVDHDLAIVLQVHTELQRRVAQSQESRNRIPNQLTEIQRQYYGGFGYGKQRDVSLLDINL